MDKQSKSQLDARMYGVWERVKVKNEEMLYKSMGKSEEYDMIRDMQVSLTIKKTPNGREEVYKRGDMLVTSKIEGEGFEITVGEERQNTHDLMIFDTSKLLHNGVQFTHNGIKRKQTKEIKKEELVLHDEYEIEKSLLPMKLTVHHYFKKI